jgi:EmrB/QacA subfamily drug resistance transporter
VAAINNPGIYTSSKRATLLIVILTSFLTPFMSSSVNIALPSIGEEFSLNAVALSWVATAFSLAVATFLVPFGRVADIAGRKKIFTWGVIVYTLSSILLGISTSGTMLISVRVLQGIGGAMTFGTAVAILTSVYPPGERGKAFGIYVSSVYVGLSIGPPFGGFLTQYFGWRSIFLVTVPLGIAVIAVLLWKLKGEWAEAKGEKFDYPGSIVYSLALAAIMYGFSIVPSIAGGGLIAVGVIGILAFVWWEMRIKSPVLNMNVFKHNITFLFSNLAALINYCATSAVSFLLSLYLQYIKGFNPYHAGLILISQPIVMAILSPFAGRLSDRIEPRIVASIGMAITTIGLTLLTLLDQGTSLAFMLVTLVILGLGFACFSSPNTNAS